MRLSCFWPPGFRPIFWRNDRLDGLSSPSLLGGLELFRLLRFKRASSSATLAMSDAMRTFCFSMMPSNSASLRVHSCLSMREL
jgi:hypothetical protein